MGNYIIEFSLHNASDEELMRCFCESLDEDAFRVLTERYYEKAIAIASGKLHSNVHLAQDAVQESFIRIIKSRKRYNSEKSFSAWFFTILRNICIDFLRKEIRQHSAIKDLFEVIRKEPGFRSTMDFFHDIMDSLNELEKNMLLLRYVYGFSFAELSEHYECSPDAMKKRVQRLLARLRE